jgi:hypothetical protein
MPQDVPEFRFGDDALRLRQFLYEHWCTHGYGPNLRAVHEATGLPRERIVAAYRQLDLGLICVVQHETQNLNVLKIQPFSSYPSQVAVHLDGRFHCYAGCAMESIALSRMPPFTGREVRLESYCACCLAPIAIVTQDGEVRTAPEGVRIHVSTSPREWNTTNIVSMCDGMNYVLGVEHAVRYERMVSRLGVLFTLEQARRFVSQVAAERMWRYDWPPGTVRPERIIEGIRGLGVDVSNWGV